MPTIGEVYDPLVEAARNNDAIGHELLLDTAKHVLEANPTKFKGIEDAAEGVKRNLDYYCQYFDEPTADKVKAFYQLGPGFRGLDNKKYPFS